MSAPAETPPPPATARDHALAEIAKLPLTDEEWQAVHGIAVLLQCGGVSIEGLRVLSRHLAGGDAP